MHLPSLLLALIPLASADCFGSGESWQGYQGAVLNTLRDTLCKADQIGGHFEQDQTKSACVVLGDGIHANLEIRRKGGPLDISEGDCYFYFDREVSACGNGGSREYENWAFTWVALLRAVADRGMLTCTVLILTAVLAEEWTLTSTEVTGSVLSRTGLLPFDFYSGFTSFDGFNRHLIHLCYVWCR